MKSKNEVVRMMHYLIQLSDSERVAIDKTILSVMCKIDDLDISDEERDSIQSLLASILS